MCWVLTLHEVPGPGGVCVYAALARLGWVGLIKKLDPARPISRPNLLADTKLTSPTFGRKMLLMLCGVALHCISIIYIVATYYPSTGQSRTFSTIDN
jgi:hypothetical protein